MRGFKETDVFLCLGRRGSGKSYLARRIQAAYPRKVIFDTMGEYSARDGVICRGFNDFSEKILGLEHANQFTLIYQFDVERENNAAEFNEAMRVLYYRKRCMVVVEEVQNFASAHHLPLWLRNALLLGRHRNLALLFTTQRPGECHKTIISQSEYSFFGSLHEKNDLDYCRTVLREHTEKLIMIPERYFLFFQPGHPLKRIKNDLTEETQLN